MFDDNTNMIIHTYGKAPQVEDLPSRFPFKIPGQKYERPYFGKDKEKRHAFSKAQSYWLKNFTTCYDQFDPYIYVIGGEAERFNVPIKGKLSVPYCNLCAKFDTFNLKWKPMPKMLSKRSSPGAFLSQDK